MDADELMMTGSWMPVLRTSTKKKTAYEILTAPDDFSAVREALEKAGHPDGRSCRLPWFRRHYVELTSDENDVKNLQRTLDLLDEDDDVTDVWTNWDE